VGRNRYRGIHPQPLKDREEPIHNRHRVLGPDEDPRWVLVSQEGVCPWTERSGARRFDRTHRRPSEAT
jgi:hypothetical protein